MLASLRGYLIAAAAALLLGGGVWFDLHVRSEQKTADAAHAETQVVKIIQKDAKISAVAGSEVSSAVQIYKQVVQLPAVADVGVVCQRPRDPAVPAAAAGGSVDHAAAALPAGPGFDPTGQASTEGRDADAEVVALQAVVRSMQKQMIATHKVH